MTTVAQLEIVDRHLLAVLDGRRALVDTGSPFDIGRGRATEILGARWEPPSTHAAALDAAEAHLGVEVEWLIGYPTLSTCRVVIDWPGRTIELAHEASEHLDFARIAIDLGQTVPIVDVAIDRKARRMVLDSGAALSYVARADVAGRAPIRTERDFHPAVGAFEVEVYTVPIVVGGRAIALDAGVLPAPLDRMLGGGCDGRILGSELFRDYVTVIDYRAGAVWQDVTAGAPRTARPSTS